VCLPASPGAAGAAGTITDLGIEFGKIFFKHQLQGWWRVQLLATLFFGYVVGALVGACVFDFWGQSAVFVPAVLVLLMAVVYTALLCRAAARSSGGEGAPPHGPFAERITIHKTLHAAISEGVPGDPARRRRLDS
jgi:hypothetical protein